MATAGHNMAVGADDHVENQAQGAEHGFPSTQVKGEGGSVRASVPAEVADRFEAAKQHAHEASAGQGPSAIDDKHKSGFEELPDRARNLTEVARAKMQTGGQAETRTPDIGFPARPNVQ
jgi:chloramphenicol 3-O-phosphotransferase